MNCPQTSKYKMQRVTQMQFTFLYHNQNYATSTQAPPTALIFSSALRLKNLALTMTGCFGKTPLPRTL